MANKISCIMDYPFCLCYNLKYLCEREHSEAVLQNCYEDNQNRRGEMK